MTSRLYVMNLCLKLRRRNNRRRDTGESETERVNKKGWLIRPDYGYRGMLSNKSRVPEEILYQILTGSIWHTISSKRFLASGSQSKPALKLFVTLSSRGLEPCRETHYLLWLAALLTEQKEIMYWPRIDRNVVRCSWPRVGVANSGETGYASLLGRDKLFLCSYLKWYAAINQNKAPKTTRLMIKFNPKEQHWSNHR